MKHTAKTTPTRVLVLTIIICAIIITFSYWHKVRGMLEGFIVTVDEVVLGSQCPDYCAYDGATYYLVFNNKSFIKGSNPLTFDSVDAIKGKLTELKCPTEPFIQNMIILRRGTNHDDPTETIERRCGKKIALNKFGIDSCAADFALSGGKGIQKEFSSIGSDALKGMSSDNLNKVEGELRAMNSGIDAGTMDNYKMIRKLVDFVNQNDESIMVDYDLETCMYEEVGNLFNGQTSQEYPPHLKQQDLGSNQLVHKFRKHFGQQEEMLASGMDVPMDSDDSNEHVTVNDLSDFKSYFDEANNVVSDDFINKVFAS
jgi:hypothetical protein